MKHWIAIASTCLALQGCVVLAVADLAATTVVKTAGLVVDGAIGTVRAVGSVFVPSSSKDKPDGKKDSKQNR